MSAEQRSTTAKDRVREINRKVRELKETVRHLNAMLDTVRAEIRKLQSQHPCGNKTGNTKRIRKYLARHPGARARDISAGTRIERMHVARLLGPLVRRGHVLSTKVKGSYSQYFLPEEP